MWPYKPTNLCLQLEFSTIHFVVGMPPIGIRLMYRVIRTTLVRFLQAPCCNLLTHMAEQKQEISKREIIAMNSKQENNVFVR